MNAVDSLLMEIKPAGGDQADLLRRMLTGESRCDPMRATGEVTLVVSPKGGCGQTTVAVNIAAARARLGARVLIVDSDRVSPSVPLFLRSLPVMERDNRGAETRWRSRRGALLTTKLASDDPALLRSLAGENDAVVVDAGPGVPSPALVSMARRVVVVTTPEFTAWRAAGDLLARVTRMCEDSFTGVSCVLNQCCDRDATRLADSTESADLACALANRVAIPRDRALALAPVLGVPPALRRRKYRDLAGLSGEIHNKGGREITSSRHQAMSRSDHMTSARASVICNVGA